MMKQSIYNLVLTDGNELLMYNSLKKTYAKSKNIVFVKKVLNNPENYAGYGITNKLKEMGFITDCEQEIELADYQYSELIYDSTLELCIMPTEQCNFRCIYCYEKFMVGRLSENNINGLILWLKKNIRNYKGVRVSWFGGEPLLAQDTIYKISEIIIGMCRLYHIPYAASITTNGYYLTKETFKKLLSFKVLSYQITIDGNRETHDKQRRLGKGEGTYNVIMNNLSEISHDVKSGIFRITIRNNISVESLKSIHSFIEEMHLKFGQDERFGFYFRPVGKWGNKDSHMKNEELLNNLNEMYELILNADKVLNYSPYRAMLDEQICFAQKRNQLVVRGNGKIAKCTMLLENEKNNIGEITSSGIDFDEYKIAKWLGLSKKRTSSCDACHVYASCFGRTCPAKGYILESKSDCGYEGKSTEYILKLLNKNDLFCDLDEVEKDEC